MEPTTQAQFDRTNILMKEFVDTVFSFYNNIKEQDVCQMADEQTLEKIRKQSIPQQGRPVEEVYREMLSDIYPNMSRVQHPRCFACIPSPVSLFSWMGDVMTNAFDPHAGSWLNSSGASCVEQELIRWMCSLTGYPQGSGGLFVSGGSMANLTALTAARDTKLTDSERSLAVAYVSDQTHSSIAKGLHIIGFRADQVRKVPSDSNFRMRLDQLTEAIREDLAAGRKPFAVIATAGTTNTGSIDPLDQIAQMSFKINQLIVDFFKSVKVDLIDFKIEFGKTSDGQIILADEISPDTCRFWDSDTHEKLDKDRFRRDLGGVEEAYEEMMRRLGLRK